jgi:phytoene dehydrogenase-like protein
MNRSAWVTSGGGGPITLEMKDLLVQLQGKIILGAPVRHLRVATNLRVKGRALTMHCNAKGCAMTSKEFTYKLIDLGAM